MGFRKRQYDVEEKGLDPEVPHKKLGDDGRLLPVEENLDTPAAVPSLKEEATLNLKKDEAEAVSKVKAEAKTPQSTTQKKSTDKKVVDEPKAALKELPDVPTTNGNKLAEKPVAKKKVSKVEKTSKRTSATKKKTVKKGKSRTVSAKTKSTKKVQKN